MTQGEIAIALGTLMEIRDSLQKHAVTLDLLSEIRDLLKAQHAVTLIQQARFNAVGALMRKTLEKGLIDREMGTAILKVLQPD